MSSEHPLTMTSWDHQGDGPFCQGQGAGFRTLALESSVGNLFTPLATWDKARIYDKYCRLTDNEMHQVPGYKLLYDTRMYPSSPLFHFDTCESMGGTITIDVSEEEFLFHPSLPFPSVHCFLSCPPCFCFSRAKTLPIFSPQNGLNCEIIDSLLFHGMILLNQISVCRTSRSRARNMGASTELVLAEIRAWILIEYGPVAVPSLAELI